MFDLGWTEMLVIAAVGLVVVGPKDLPKVVRSVAGFVRQLRGVQRQVVSQFNQLAYEAEMADSKGRGTQQQNAWDSSTWSGEEDSDPPRQAEPTPGQMAKARRVPVNAVPGYEQNPNDAPRPDLKPDIEAPPENRAE